MSYIPNKSVNNRLAKLWRELGIAAEDIWRRDLPLYDEAGERSLVETPERSFELTPETAAAWQAMQIAARRAGAGLTLISAFRSYDYQAGLIRRRLAKGESIDSILTVLAPPGCSEHHTGAALDLGTPGCPPLEEAFEQTAAFVWLSRNAQTFGFHLSYPRNNPQNYAFEPWHWLYAPPTQGVGTS